MLKTLIIPSLFAFSLLNPLFAASSLQADDSIANKSEQSTCPCNKMSMSKCQGMMDNMMMKKLGKKDAQYDLRFINLMIAHHESGIMMAKNALENSSRPEIKKLAQQVISAQEKEIKQLQEWRKEWYGN